MGRSRRRSNFHSWVNVASTLLVIICFARLVLIFRAPRPQQRVRHGGSDGEGIGNVQIDTVTTPDEDILPTRSKEGQLWGDGYRVLIFTMDSLAKTVAAAAKGGPAGEIKIRESLTASLREGGVQVMLP